MLRFSITFSLLYAAFSVNWSYRSVVLGCDPFVLGSNMLRFASPFVLASVCFGSLEDATDLSWPLYFKTVQFNYDTFYALGACLCHVVIDFLLELGPYETVVAVLGCVAIVWIGNLMMRVPNKPFFKGENYVLTCLLVLLVLLIGYKQEFKVKL